MTQNAWMTVIMICMVKEDMTVTNSSSSGSSREMQHLQIWQIAATAAAAGRC
jgi:phage terminase large subunit-like protein